MKHASCNVMTRCKLWSEETASDGFRAESSSRAAGMKRGSGAQSLTGGQRVTTSGIGNAPAAWGDRSEKMAARV